MSGTGDNVRDEIVRQARTQATRDESKRIHGCTGPHQFVPAVVAQSFGGSYTCRTCRCTITANEWAWYQRGLQHGRMGL